MFRDHADGLGSRLHIKTKQEYIAYAKWPDRNTWENSLSRLPEKSQETRRILRNTCKKIGIVYQLEVVEDFLVKE